MLDVETKDQKGTRVIKAAFFDIDGTLLSDKTNHLIPASTKDALVQLRQRGVKCCICSGRPTAQLPWCIKDGFPGFDDAFDAYITMTGSMCYDKSGVYADVPIDHETACRFVKCVEDGMFDALLLNRNGVFCNRRSEKVRELERMVAYEYPVLNFSEALNEPVYQFCAFAGPDEEHEVSDVMSDCIITRWCDLFCDVVPATSSKPKGIEATLKHLGLSREETIAFGDGGNDVTMLAYCEIGVAMGNATDDAKASADYVTTDVDKDGIALALRHYGLID